MKFLLFFKKVKDELKIKYLNKILDYFYNF
jgi:hypothetical protein